MASSAATMMQSAADRAAYQRATAVAHADVKRLGFTDHHPGMYADRFTHKNLQTEAGRYNWLGDKYKDPLPERPGRFKNKQFSTSAPVWYPGSNVEGNLYGLNGKRVPALRDGDLYGSVHAPVRKDFSTKVGFGNVVGKTKFVPDMSTSQRQARFAHALKREQRGLRKFSEEELEAMAEEAANAPKLAWEAKPNRYEEFEGEENQDPFRKFIPAHLRDHHPLTTRQERQKASRADRTYGLQRPASATVGELAWDAGKTEGEFKAEPHFKHNATKYFTDKCHVGTGSDRVAGNAPFVKPGALTYRIPKHG